MNGPALDKLLEELGANIPTPTQLIDPIEHLGDTSSVGVSTSTEERALTLLGSGVQAEAVANALGVTPSRISQLLSQEDFASKVANLRYEILQKHNVRDNAYDTLEDKLIKKLENSINLMAKPDTLIRAVSVVNNAKRRGQSSPDHVANHTNIVQLILPTIIKEIFATNLDNQVVRAGEQELLTMPSSNLLDQVKAIQKERIEHIQDAEANPELQEQEK